MIIRGSRLDDAGQIAAIYEPFVAESVITFETDPPDATEIGRRMSSRPLLPWLVADDDGTLAGYAYCSPYRARAAYRWVLECTVYVRSGLHRQGVGRRLYDALFAQARELGYLAVHAGITLPNAASVGIHESLGFEPIGVHPNVGYKFGSWHDVGWWQLRLAPLPQHPAEPREWVRGGT
jgi:phosphinothricin acetyltransferase